MGVPSDIEMVNTMFYEAHPSGYFDRRLHGVLSFVPPETPLPCLQLVPLPLWFMGTMLRANREGEERKGDLIYALAESEILFHHSAEALLRLFLAHTPQRRCPALALSGMRGPGKFARQTGEVLAESRQDKAKKHACYAFSLREDWAEADNILEYLRYFKHLLDYASGAYNSAKHGLALSAVEMSVKFEGTPLPEVGNEIEGDMLACLEKGKRGEEAWWHSWFFTDMDSSLALSRVAAILIDRLWKTARHRYLGEPLSLTPDAGLPAFGTLMTPEIKKKRGKLSRALDVESFR